MSVWLNEAVFDAGPVCRCGGMKLCLMQDLCVGVVE